MKHLWLEQQELSFRTESEVPQPGPGECLVRVRLAGICSTDLEMIRGYYPFTGIPGHEFVGEVDACHPGLFPEEGGEPDWLGRRVVGEINLACGVCPTCRRGDRTHCEDRTVVGIRGRNGCFASYLTLPFENLHPVPDPVSDEAAVFTEPLAAALEIQQQVQIRPEMQVLVIGAGRLGQLVAQTLALTACNLKVVARHPEQKALLAERRIALASEDEISSRQTDLVVEATGSPDGWELARRTVRPRGTIVLKSTYKGDLTVNFSSLVVDEVTLLGSRCGPFAPALRLLENRQVDPTCLIRGRYALEQGLLAYQQAGLPGGLKILLQPGL